MTTIPEAYEEFLAAQSVAGLKPRSLSWYKTMLKPLIIQLYQKDIREVSAVDIRLALSYLKSRSTRYKDAPQRCETTGGLSQQTVRDHFAAFRRFFSWIWLEYELDPRLNPMRKVPMPKRTEYEPKAITLDDLMALLKACGDSLKG